MSRNKRKAPESSGDEDEENDQDSSEYRQKRQRNNASVQKSRNRSRQKEAETAERVEQLKLENGELERKVEILKKELQFLRDMFIAFAAGKKSAGADGSGSSTETSSAQLQNLLTSTSTGSSGSSFADLASKMLESKESAGDQNVETTKTATRGPAKKAPAKRGKK